MSTVKADLMIAGWNLVTRFCRRNKIDEPELNAVYETWRVGACGYYRPKRINICVPLCAAPGYVGRAWSWPGYVVDRTPYGVAAHELGHHVDLMLGKRPSAYYSEYSGELHRKTLEPPLTSYAQENDAEWFAEAFRLFVTNPSAMAKLMPKTYAELSKFFLPVVDADANGAMSIAGIPVKERHISALWNKFAAVEKYAAQVTERDRKLQGRLL